MFWRHFDFIWALDGRWNSITSFLGTLFPCDVTLTLIQHDLNVMDIKWMLKHRYMPLCGDTSHLVCYTEKFVILSWLLTTRTVTDIQKNLENSKIPDSFFCVENVWPTLSTWSVWEFKSRLYSLYWEVQMYHQSVQFAVIFDDILTRPFKLFHFIYKFLYFSFFITLVTQRSHSNVWSQIPLLWRAHRRTRFQTSPKQRHRTTAR